MLAIVDTTTAAAASTSKQTRSWFGKLSWAWHIASSRSQRAHVERWVAVTSRGHVAVIQGTHVAATATTSAHVATEWGWSGTAAAAHVVAVTIVVGLVVNPEIVTFSLHAETLRTRIDRLKEQTNIS